MVAAHAKMAFTVTEMKALLKSKSVGRSKGKNDRIEKNRGGVSYYLFGNEIGHYDPSSRTLTVSDGNHLSMTTANRVNLLMPRGHMIRRDYTFYLVMPGKPIVEWVQGKTNLKFKV